MSSRRSHGRRLRGLLLAWSLLAAACSSGPATEVAAEGPPLRVEILDPWFVRVDGQRLARHEFLFRAREDWRARAREQRAGPPVRLSWEEGAAPQDVVDEMLTQLRLAGVQVIELGAR